MNKSDFLSMCHKKTTSGAETCGAFSQVMLGAIPLVMTDDYIKKVSKRPAQGRTAYAM
jgi:hypothetical protein